ncbi:MAG TPA: HAMP domain-containing sensor histidine kinase [Chloroflexota bacterium]
MVSGADRVRRAEREDGEILDARTRLEFERMLQWLRLSFLAAPVLVVVAFGPSALAYAGSIVGAVAVSFGWVALLVARWPRVLLRAQLWLRALDCGVVYVVLVNYHAFLGNAYYDSVYLLFVVAAAATHGRRGSLVLSAVAGVAVLMSRLQLIGTGALAFEVRHFTDAVFYTLFFAVTSSAVAFLMRKSAEVVRRREQAWRVELEEAIQLRDAMLTGVTHDLRTPLTVIKVQTQLARRRPDAGPFDATLAQIERAATRMSGWIDELLEASKVQSLDEMQLDLQPTDLTELARQAVAAHQQTTNRHLLKLEGEPGPVIGGWDGARLARVLDNLLGNAVKFSPQGGRIGVRIHVADGRAVLVVYDEGIGIATDDFERIFDPFQRGSNVEGRISGTGIGLTSTRRIVERHRGRIEVSSIPGRGSAFTVYLPLIQRDS